MARKCSLGGKAPQYGNNVSHSNRKTRRRWMVNVQSKNLYSLALGKYIRVSLPANMIRTVDNAGGLDNYLLRCSVESLDGVMLRIRNQIQSKLQKVAA
ncbi:MAG: 50S ribosomal protein L28 [Magnetococcales bacterium]|nr:50S ribosomal protein L28 [Magnetococcales bacterium]